MSESIIDVSRSFFTEIVKPILQEKFPAETAVTAFGVFGYGSEVLGLDDELSRDHHWGLRVDALMPDEVFQHKREEILAVCAASMPESYRGYQLRSGHVTGPGLAPESLPAFLRRTIGIEHAARSYAEWLSMPEEDIMHVINGEVWHDPSGHFSAIRATLLGYYPEAVRRRRIAHWCRYFSGMGTYALKRALLRTDWVYATTCFSTALRLGIQLAFLLDRQYFPYDKWLMAFFRRLPRMYDRLHEIVEEAVALSTPWPRKLELLNQMADVLDTALVEDGVIAPHPRFQDHPTSGYRLLEHAYAEIIQNLPAAIKTVVPVWDQIYLERFHSGYVDGLPLAQWDEILNLRDSTAATRLARSPE